MLRPLILSTLFPNAARPNLGIFVERQLLGLAERDDVELQIVAPVGLPIWPLSRHPHYRPLADFPQTESWKGLTVHRPHYRVWPRLGTARTPLSLAQAVLPVIEQIRKSFAFNIIQAEFFWPDGPAAMRLAKHFDLPFSIKARGADVQYWGRHPASAAQTLKAAWAADGLLAVSSGLKDEMVDLGWPGGKIKIHHTGIDLERFNPEAKRDLRRELKISGPVIITPGALIPRKGQALAIEAMKGLPGATLLLVGDGPDRRSLERLTERLGLQARIRFLGSRPHEEMPGLLSAADVMLLMTASEGLANVWVESLACGTPVVTTDMPGAREAVSSPWAGRLIPRSAEAAVSAVAELLADPPPVDRIRSSAERFSWERNRFELFDHLAVLASRKPQGRNLRAA